MTKPAALAALVLTAAALTACGGEGEGAAAPTDASRQDYCAAFASQFQKLSQLGPDDAREAVEATHDWARELRRAGTPEDMPEDARRGFEAFVDDLAAVDDNASAEDLQDLGSDAQEEVEAFVTYSLQTCPDAMGSMLGDLGDQMDQELGDLDLGDMGGMGDLGNAG